MEKLFNSAIREKGLQRTNSKIKLTGKSWKKTPTLSKGDKGEGNDGEGGI